MERTISFTLNDKPVRITTGEDRMLLWVLRYELGLTGTKYGCGEALCGACTVIVDGNAVRSCSVPIKEVAGKRVLTIEGLSREDHLDVIQEAFLKHRAFQCGYCTPGMIMSAHALLSKTAQPTRDDIIRHMNDNLCRCGSHLRVVDAIQDAAAMRLERVRGGKAEGKSGVR